MIGFSHECPGGWGELMLLDSGAQYLSGTTDITLARLDEEDGKPAFSAFHSLGYDGMGGNRVNQEFLGWCVQQWLSGERLTGPATEDPIGLKGEKSKLSRRRAARHCRRIGCARTPRAGTRAVSAGSRRRR